MGDGLVNVRGDIIIPCEWFEINILDNADVIKMSKGRNNVHFIERDEFDKLNPLLKK